MLKRGTQNNLGTIPSPNIKSPPFPHRKGVDMRIKKRFMSQRARSRATLLESPCGEWNWSGWCWWGLSNRRLASPFDSSCGSSLRISWKRRLRLHAEQLPQWKLIEAIWMYFFLWYINNASLDELGLWFFFFSERRWYKRVRKRKGTHPLVNVNVFVWQAEMRFARF